MKRTAAKNLSGPLAGLGLLGGAALVLFFAAWPAKTEKTAPPAPPASPSVSRPPAAEPGTLVETARPTAADSAPLPDAPLPVGETAREAIHELAITYDAAAIPALARFLDHPDAEIREAAREGLVNLGERAAIPALEAAARRTEGAEAQALREAAEFLALPTWTERKARLKTESR